MLSHISFGEGPKTLAILIPSPDFNAAQLRKHYVEPLEEKGIPKEQIIAFNLELNDQGKAPVGLIRPCLDKIERLVKKLEVKDVLICDSRYFKTLCKARKSDPHYGYPMDTLWDGIKGFICPNYRALFYNPAFASKIDFSLTAISNHLQQKGGMFDAQVLQNSTYPSGAKEVSEALNTLLTVPALTCDIEGYSLKVNKAKLPTISFGLDEHSAVTFPVAEDRTVRHFLKKFFEDYQGKLIFHGSPYDCKVIIWELFMEHPLDMKGMLHGLHTMFRNLDDTKIIAYLALNSTTTISLKLKDLAFEHTGNYALDDIDDITKYTLAEILEYNATDTVGTWYVYNLYRQIVRDEQEQVYQEIFRPALKAITQMELCGVPINLGKVLTTEQDLQDIADVHYKAIMANPVVTEATQLLREKEAVKANKKLKKLRKTADDFMDFEFNPNSPVQLAFLLYDFLGLPILAKTDTGAPSTGNKTLKALIKRIERSRKWKQHTGFLEHLIEYHDVDKILTTFIPAFKENTITKNGWEYLHGGFNLGGTKSGRLSSSNPNLQNIPSTGTQYAKAIKKCFQAPPHTTPEWPKGWLLVGADFASLEDRISALQTKDPNKLKIYTDGYDGHCLRAYSYFGEKMPDIIPDDVQSINSIKKKYPKLRQLSKSPTFLLTYMGTWHGLIKQFGFTKEVAKKIEDNFKKLYAVSIAWVKKRVYKAGDTGYVDLAFGLRIRTPILPQVVLDSDTLPYQAEKEIKTAGNALGQSYGLLNTRANNEFMQRVWKSKYATKILSCMQVHDSQYYMIENTVGCLKWVNDNLIECMEWNDLPEIQHPTIKLEAQLEVYYPDWSKPIDIPNRLSAYQIRKRLEKINTAPPSLRK